MGSNLSFKKTAVWRMNCRARGGSQGVWEEVPIMDKVKRVTLQRRHKEEGYITGGS